MIGTPKAYKARKSQDAYIARMQKNSGPGIAICQYVYAYIYIDKRALKEHKRRNE